MSKFGAWLATILTTEDADREPGHCKCPDCNGSGIDKHDFDCVRCGGEGIVDE